MKSALQAGYTRFRPVLMTALAMIIGMAPMALALGQGGEQNAPLGRAVIGGWWRRFRAWRRRRYEDGVERRLKRYMP